MAVIFRWVLFLPASIFSGWLAYLISKIGLLSDFPPFIALLDLSAHAGMGYVFTAVGTAVAPSKKFIVSVFLSIICVCFTIASVYLSIFSAKDIFYKLLIVGCCLFLIGGSLAYTLNLYKEQKKG